LPKSRAIETKSFGELSGHVLDEIIAEKINNFSIQMEGPLYLSGPILSNS
jgi:hypothetical protein